MTPSTTAASSRKDHSCCCSPLLPPAPTVITMIRTVLTSTVGAATSVSGRDCTSASARRWPGWKLGWPSKRFLNVGPTGKSTTPTPNGRTPQACAGGHAYRCSPDELTSVLRKQRRANQNRLPDGFSAARGFSEVVLPRSDATVRSGFQKGRRTGSDRPADRDHLSRSGGSTEGIGQSGHRCLRRTVRRRVLGCLRPEHRRQRDTDRRSDRGAIHGSVHQRDGI